MGAVATLTVESSKSAFIGKFDYLVGILDPYPVKQENLIMYFLFCFGLNEYVL